MNAMYVPSSRCIACMTLPVTKKAPQKAVVRPDSTEKTHLNMSPASYAPAHGVIITPAVDLAEGPGPLADPAGARHVHALKGPFQPGQTFDLADASTSSTLRCKPVTP